MLMTEKNRVKVEGFPGSDNSAGKYGFNRSACAGVAHE
jgi:hypothetical protein